jgi:CRP-like cAMP-binding protein
MAESKIEQLRRVRLFSGLRKADLEMIAINMDEVLIGSGSTLISQGKSNHAFYLLLQGEVEVSVADRPRRTMGPGEFFGEISMEERGPATATVVTKGPVRAYVMSHAQFTSITANEPMLLRLKAAMAEWLLADRRASAES